MAKFTTKSRRQTTTDSCSRHKIQSRILKQDRFSNPKAALALISHIISSGGDINMGKVLDPLIDYMNKKIEEFHNQNFRLMDNDSFQRTWNLCKDYLYECAEDPYETIKIAVAGGFSSGKSSLLNLMLGLQAQLPTGIDPVSVINTQIVCDKDITNFSIFGTNIKEKEMRLNSEVLGSIQHSSQSKVYVSKVLKKLTIYNKVSNGSPFEGLTFIDTPGYNNTAFGSGTVGSDRDKALTGIRESDALLWCIDIAQGTLTNEDIKMLKECPEDISIVIVFTKIDMRDEYTIKNVLNKTREQLSRQGIKTENICAVSAHTGKEYSLGGISLLKGGVFGILKRKFNTFSEYYLDYLDKEIEASQETIKDLEQKRQEIVKKLQDARATKDEDLEYLKILEYELKDRRVNPQIISNVVQDYKTLSNILWDIDDLEERKKETIKSRQTEEATLKFLLSFRNELASRMRQYRNTITVQKRDLLRKAEGIASVESDNIFNAIRSGSIDEFERALSKGFDEGARDSQGYSPLTRAIKEGNISITKRFIELNADITGEDARGYTPFETAVMNHNKVICDELIAADRSVIDLCKEDLLSLSRRNKFEEYLSTIKN